MGKDEAERRFEASDQRISAVEKGVRATKIESQRFEVWSLFILIIIL
jgi:hypothetical protein